jgi:hypothetical protein
MLARAGGGELDGFQGDLGLGQVAMAGDGLDRMAVLIPGGELHVAVNVGGVAAQGRFHDAQGFHKLLPVHRAEEAQAADAVTDGNLVRRLILAVEMDQQLDGLALFDQDVFQPRAGELQKRAALRQAQAELRHERAGEGKPGLAMSATTITRCDGLVSAISCRRPTHSPASSQSSRAVSSLLAMRWRFSISPSRSMIGMAHSSPSFRVSTDW